MGERRNRFASGEKRNGLQSVPADEDSRRFEASSANRRKFRSGAMICDAEV